MSKKRLNFSLELVICSMFVYIAVRSRSIWNWLIGFILLLVPIVKTMNLKKEVRATIEKVEKIDDGYICITWGYINPNRFRIKVQQGESCLLVKNGTALILDDKLPSIFEHGHHRFVIRTIVKEESNIEWVIGQQRTEYSTSYKNTDWSYNES